MLLFVGWMTVLARRVLWCRLCGTGMPVVELAGAYRCPRGHTTLVDDAEERT